MKINRIYIFIYAIFCFLVYPIGTYAIWPFTETIDISEVEKSNELFYKRGDKDPFSGIIVEYFNNGSLKRRYEIKDGRFHGVQNEWYANGNKELEINTKNGLPNGKYHEWYENGQKLICGYLKAGKEDGSFESWYENGQIIEKIEYDNGKRDGDYNCWYKNGQKKIEAEYKKGGFIGWKYAWYENGNKMHKIKYNGSSREEALFWGSNEHFWDIEGNEMISHYKKSKNDRNGLRHYQTNKTVNVDVCKEAICETFNDCHSIVVKYNADKDRGAFSIYRIYLDNGNTYMVVDNFYDKNGLQVTDLCGYVGVIGALE